jgi:type IV pilus assembly protein PilY1
MKYFSIVLIGLFTFFPIATSVAAKKPAQVEAFSCNNYALTPAFLADAVAPSTTLIVDSSGSMNNHAYQEIRVDWRESSSNRAAHTGYNALNPYYGYFDPYSYYLYDTSKDYFYEDINGTWSGNFLNWATMHRTDIVRKVLTGGPYNILDGTYKVSRTDGSSSRGRYHVYDDSNGVTDINGTPNKHQTPYHYKIGLEQSSSNDLLNVFSMTEDTGYTPIRWTKSSTTAVFSETLKVKSEKKYGLLDRFGYRMRLALFRYDDDGSNNNGGKILNYMTSDPTQISNIIDNIDTLSMDSWTPLAETLHTVVGYIQQSKLNDESKNGPKYENDSYDIGKSTTPDPFYFSDLKKNIYCTQQNVILITDGESTQDLNVPDKFKTADADKGNNDGAAYPDSGSGYLDNIAYWAHTTDLRSDLEGVQNINLYTIFAFGSGSQLLKDAAKWGGFNDANNNGLPDSGEWDSVTAGEPDNYFEAASGEELENALVVAFSSILNRVSSGSAASVVSTSRKGEGLLYQAVFWPQRSDKTEGNEISWAGDVYAYWLDDEGIMHEDSNSNSKLDSDDKKLTIWYDSVAQKARACIDGEVVNGSCTGTDKDITSVRHAWSAAKWLNRTELLPLDQRTNYSSTDSLGNSKRFIQTWKDDGDGIVDQNEIVAFTSSNINNSYCSSDVVDWIRGYDSNSTNFRSRNIYIDTDYNESEDKSVTWRLGDIINSSPTVVAAPAENYDLLWEDASYTPFYKKYKDRRIMVYFGANDGMLHAVNSGFYSPNDRAYYKHRHTNGTYDDSQGFDLGAEMWAYVPYNLVPHLSCLTDKKYQHQYYVDLKPRIFEAQIFGNDVDHPNGWGTILVTGFNFGGDGQQDLVNGAQYFGSSFFIFDITNPENEPVFLGEFTYDGEYTMGYTLNQPTLVAVKDTAGEKHWYMLFGTGPLTAAGSSTQKAQVVVVPMAQLVDKTTNTANTSFSLRLANDKDKPTMDTMGVLSLSDSNSAMGTGFVSVDYDFDFFIDMMYYGTVVTPNSGVMTGGVHRLKIEAEPDPSKWERKEMTDTDRPLTGAPNIGFKDKNVWVYFGTGKFWDVSDKTDLRTQWMYGIMEPKKTGSSAYNFSTIPTGNLMDVTGIQVKNDGLGTLVCDSSMGDCPPSTVKTVEELAEYIRVTNSIDGWKRALPNVGERVVGQPTLFGGLTNFTTFTPSSDYCTAEGSSKLYALYYLTGTAWKEDVFGDSTSEFVPFVVDLGKGMGVSPSLHLGSEEGVRAYVQTSTGSIIEIHQPNLPIPNVKSGRGGWHTLEVD